MYKFLILYRNDTLFTTAIFFGGEVTCIELTHLPENFCAMEIADTWCYNV